jgi:hypothetical protein
MLSNVSLSVLGMLILVVSGYLISTFFDLEMAYYMPYLLWLLGLCVFNMFLDKSHINIYTKKTNNDGEETKTPAKTQAKIPAKAITARASASTMALETARPRSGLIEL